MPDSTFATHRIRAILARSKHDRATAQRQLLAECARDARLLRALTAPFLNGIAAHSVQRVADAESSAKTAAAPGLSPAALDSVVGHLGKTIGERDLPRGMTALVEPPVPKAAGKAHQDAVREMAASFARKRMAQRG